MDEELLHIEDASNYIFHHGTVIESLWTPLDRTENHQEALNQTKASNNEVRFRLNGGYQERGLVCSHTNYHHSPCDKWDQTRCLRMKENHS